MRSVLLIKAYFMTEDRAKTDDMFVGILIAVLHPRTGHITWGFKEYDPADKENFPLPVQFKEAGKLVKHKNPGRVLDVQNDDALVVFVDHGYTHMVIRGVVTLDYEIGKVPDPLKPGEQVQMLGSSRVNGIPTNIDTTIWCEAFFEGSPAILFRRKASALNVA